MTELKWIRGNAPVEEGWYRVMHPGDTESSYGYTIYEYGDYPGWAYWNPEVKDDPISTEVDFNGLVSPMHHDAYWSCEHDEEGDFIIAYCGPIFIPEIDLSKLPTEPEDETTGST